MTVLVFVHYYVNHQGLPLQKIEGCYCRTLIKGSFVKLKLQCCNEIRNKEGDMLKELYLIRDKRLFIDFDVREIQL